MWPPGTGASLASMGGAQFVTQSQVDLPGLVVRQFPSHFRLPQTPGHFLCASTLLNIGAAST
jgi:hypothetical protein